MARRYRPSDVPFCGLCQVLDAINNASADKKVKHLKNFHDNYLEKQSGDYYAIYRLLLPNIDLERGYYQLKEQDLANLLVKACAASPEDSKRVVSWRDAANSKGDLVETAYECLLAKHCGKAKGQSTLTVGQVNALFDDLARSSKRDDQKKVLMKLILELAPEEMKWVLRLVLRNKMRFGLGLNHVLSCIHPKAQELYNFTMTLRKVCEQLANPELVLETQRVVVGNVVKPHLAKRVDTVHEAFEVMEGKAFVVETKFDGERIQVHKCRDGSVRYFARSGIDHGPYSSYSALDEMFLKLLVPPECVLDGEIIIWHAPSRKFLPFGSIKSVVKAVDQGKEDIDVLDNRGLLNSANDVAEKHLRLADCQVVYIAFDVLYTEHEGQLQSVLKLPLRERHELLKKTVSGDGGDGGGGIKLKASCCSGKIIKLLPGECEYSRLGTDENSLQRQFDESISQEEEGIMVKDLSSEWVAANRGYEWLKLKPDYVNEVEVDAIIIGATYGTGKRGGRLAQYLLGIPRGKGHSDYLLTFCRVGTGLSEAEQQQIHDILQENLSDEMPAMYRATGHRDETPHVWVSDPEKSIVLEVIGDVRTIATTIYATGRSLRFPRVKRMRGDKGIHDLTTLEEVLEQKTEEIIAKRKQKEAAAAKRKGKKISVPKEFLPSCNEKGPGLEPQSSMFSRFLFYQITAGEGGSSKEEMESAIRAHGGKVTQNFVSNAGERELICFADHLNWKVKNVILPKVDTLYTSAWVFQCIREGRLVACDRPKYYFKNRLLVDADHDDYGDSFTEEIDTEDLKMLLLGMEEPGKEDPIHPELMGILVELQESWERQEEEEQAASPAGVAGGAVKQKEEREEKTEVTVKAERVERAEDNGNRKRKVVKEEELPVQKRVRAERDGAKKEEGEAAEGQVDETVEDLDAFIDGFF